MDLDAWIWALMESHSDFKGNKTHTETRVWSLCSILLHHMSCAVRCPSVRFTMKACQQVVRSHCLLVPGTIVMKVSTLMEPSARNLKM